MIWIMLTVWILFPILYAGLRPEGDPASEYTTAQRHNDEEGMRIAEKKIKKDNILMTVFLGPVFIMFLGLLLYGLYLAWYYLCAGGLVTEVAETPGDKFTYFLASLVPFSFVITFVIWLFAKLGK